MLKWFSGEEGEPGSGGPGSPHRAAGGGDVAVEEIAERLTQTEQLVTQLKEMIREKDAALRTKDDQFKVEKEACEAKLSKLRLQNKAKVTSLTTQLEELKKQQGGQGTPTQSKKGSSEGGGEQASRGKIVLLKKKVEELEQQLAQRDEELENKRKEVESQQQRGEEMDTMLTEKERKLAEKEAYIVHLQTALAGDQPISPAPQQKVAEDSVAMQELQLLVQSLTKKVGEAEERYSLLQEQTDSLKELLATEKEQYSQKESMYKQNIQTFKDILIQKDNQLMEINQMHEQELFKLASKSDASADLEQLLKALKQKLHEKEEVLLGKTQVIDVLQGEVDGRDQQIKELTERLRRLQVERESLESKMEAEKHVMRAQLRDLMEKQQAEVQRMTKQHQSQLDQIQQDLLGQLEELRRASVAAPPASQEASGTGSMPADSASIQRIAELEAQAKQKTDEASRSEAKFLKMKAWSKSRIRQLEEELKKSQAGVAPPDLTALRSRITALEEEREENLWKVEQYEELKAKNEMLEAKLVVYEEQQRTLQADLEQFTKRAASQASESGSADDTQSQVLEWQEMVAEAVSARDRAREEKAAMALRISNMEEEREALATRQQELEEELAQARGLGHHRAKRLTAPAQRSLQEDFEFDGQVPFQDPRSTSESTTPMEGENMGDGLRSVVEELELERNQLQEQILSLEERCQDLEDRLQLQSRIEALQVTFDVDEDEQPYTASQNESEKLQSQLASVRSQQSRDAEKHQLLVSSLNEQLKGLSDTQECLESSLIEKENTLAKTSEKLELINSLRESLSEKEIQYREVSDKLLQTEHTLENISKKCSSSEKQCSELKTEVADLTQKLNVLKEKTQKQEVTTETLQTELDQTNEELDKLNTAHLEERAQLIHDLQTCEREIDSLKDILLEKDKEISTLSANMVEYAEQVTVLKQEIKLKEENLVHVESALSKAEREVMIIRESQNSDQQGLNSKVTEVVGKLKDTEMELIKAKEERESKLAEVEHLVKQAGEDKKTIQDLRGEIQKQIVSHRNHLSECETCITSLKEQLTLSNQKLQESEGLALQLKDKNTNNEKLKQELHDKEQTYEKELKSFKEEHNKLLAQVEKYSSEMQTLSKQLEQKVQSEEHVQKEMQEKLETIASLENQLKANDKQAEDERQKFNSELLVRDSENQKLSNDLKSKSENISKLKNQLKSMKTEKQQLHEKLKGLTEELQLQKQNVKELNEKVTSAHELNSSLENQVHSLTKEKERLELEVTESVKNISEVTVEKDSLQAKLSILETQHSQNNKIIEGLQKDKEELTLRTNELNIVFEQSTHSNSEILLAKTNECSNLNQLLRDKEDTVTQLQEQVQSLTSKVDQLQHDIAEKEQTATDLCVQLEAQQNQQTQLQETLSVLREQECGLKSGLMEKDAMLQEKQEEYHSLQNEIATQKKTVSKLQADAESLNEEHSQLRQQLQEREEMLRNTTKQCKKHQDELNDTNKTVKSLNDQISVMEENARKLESEVELRQTELTSLNSHIQTLTEENHKLQAACESTEKELAQQTQVVSDLDGQLKEALEQNSSFSVMISSLTEDKQRLQEELAQNIRSVFELTTERSLLQEKNSGLEIHIADSQKKISSLLKEKGELAIAADELKNILEKSELSNSANLLEKTSECVNLSRTLREREEQLHSLQEQVDGLKMQVSQLNMSLNEKEQTLSEQSSRLEAQQNQLLQLHDTISMLQEQGSVFKSGLMEKDTMFQQKAEECRVYENEVKRQRDLISQIQGEVESLRQECSDAKQQIEKKEQTLKEVTNQFQNHKDELNKRNESVISLSSQLGAMNENAAEMEVEITNLKTAVQKLTAENCQLTQEEDQRKAEIIDFKDSIQALNEQNTRLKSEFRNTVTVLSKAQEEVTHLKKSLFDRDNELKTAYSEKDALNLTMEGKDDFLKQQESLIEQLNSRIAEQEEQLKQQADDNVSLHAKISELEDSDCKLRGQVDSLTSESSILKNTLEEKEHSSLESQSHSSAAVENLNSNLQAKEAECESLKEQISHLGESVTKLNSTLQVQIAETENLKKALVEKEAALLDQSKSLQDIQRTADEALLFKTQFMESTELVSQLQSQIQLLSTESENLRKSVEETQSAFNNLQEKYATNLEELQDVRKQLSQRTDETSNLRTLLGDSNKEHQTAETTIETLRNELSAIHHKLEKTEDLNSSLSKEKDEAFSSHQASVSLLTVEIERLKSQHLQVIAQMNALTENLEQREMALHAINSQYTAQAKHASQLVSEIQKLEKQNKRLNEEIRLSKEEYQKHLTADSNENTHLQEEVRKLLAEKEELERRHHQIWTSQGELQFQMEQQTGSMNEIMEKMVSEKETLQAKVSAKDEELSQLKENIRKIEQILQDSEKEWLLVLDREKQDKNLLAEHLKSVENEMKSKDIKVNALKQDLDSLQEKLAEASSAVRQGSDQLSAKELEASASRIQLEKVLASFQEKDKENNNLQQALKTVEYELQKLVARKNGTDKDSSVLLPTSSERSAALNESQASLQDMIKQLQERQQSEVDALKNELDKTVANLHKTQNTLHEGERGNEAKGQQIALLQETVEHLQTQLNAESENVKEAAIKHSLLHSELQAKDEQINCMSIQISQQKELLTGLSQQIRDRDASIAQIMESASNERMKLGEEKTSLIAQLVSMEQAHKTSIKRSEEISQQLEDHISRSQSEIDSKNSEKLELIKKNDDLKGELAKVSKEKDAIKKKLQAALILRKNLLKKIEEYENQKEESVNNKTEVSILQDKLKEITNQSQATAKMYQEKVSLLEQRILEKEGEILEHKTESERLVEQLQSEKHLMQATLNEKEVCLSEKLQTLSEKSSLIEQLQSSVAEKEEAFKQDRNRLIQKLEELQNEIKTCKDESKDKSSSTAAAVYLENELAQMKSEKAILQKKAQAALLARKETIKKAQEKEKKLTQELAELKDDYKALLEQHCQQTNELNAVQLNFDEKVRELEVLHKTSLSYLDELDTLRQLVEERDKTLQDLKMSLAEKESQCHSLSHLQTELETVKSKTENMSFEMTRKDEALVIMEQRTEALESKLHIVENDLERAHAEVGEKMEEIEKYKETIKVAEIKTQQEKLVLSNENISLKTQLNIFETALEEHICANKEKYQILMEEKEAVLEQSNQMKVELETTLALVSQKSLEVLTIQKTLAETQQQLSENKDVLTKELEKAPLHCTETERNSDLLKQEKENAFTLIEELRGEVTTLNKKLKEAEKLNEQLHQKMPETCINGEDVNKEGVCFSCNCAENFKVILKERDDALLVSQAQLAEKEELISALELQLQEQMKRHETAIEKMRIEADELQKSREVGNKMNGQDNQSKIALLTRKLQAALVSRKELLKENSTLKEEVEKVSAKHEAKEVEYFVLESSVSKLKQRNMDLENSVSSLKKEKDKLSDEADRVLNDNRSLSAACDSLKLTIENITQQKQAFSCQLESLKDSQTEELSKWKSKHAELKQEYESLLQAYENVSSEMDKMRQLLEGAKRDRQEALRKVHKHETEMEILEEQAREMEEENERLKDRIHTFSKEKRQKIEELEEENQKIRIELTEHEGNHKMAMCKLTDKNKQLEAEICQLKESSKDLRVKLTETQTEKSQLAVELEEANGSLEKKHLESNTYTNNMQVKLDEALSLNNSLTAQIEAQKTDLGAQLEINNLLQKEKQSLSERIEKLQNDHELQLGKKDDVIKELRDIINRHSQETISLNEKVRILEDDKSLLQEELENIQEISDKVKNENEYLETVILKNSERIDELTESVKVLQTQNTQLSSQLTASKEMSNQVRQEKEEEQLKLVREFEEKLKTVRRGNEGSKNVKKELQELLKEKHQEINQLQQNCIKYQEVILDLESSLKSSQSACKHLEKEQKKSSEKISVLEERSKQVEDELITHKKLLQGATEKIVRVESERDQLALEISQQSKQSEDQAAEKTVSPQNIDEKQIHLYMENQFLLQQQIDSLKDLKDKESQKVNELRKHVDSQDLQINTLKRAAETNEAKLSALSSTHQGADATKLWNDLYQKTLNEKDNQLLEQGFVIKRFLEDMRAKDKEVNELRVTKSRLERTLNEYSVAAAAQQRQLFVMSASNAELTESVELMTVQVKEFSAQVERIEQDKNAIHRQLADKEDVISRMQLNLQQMEKINADTDAQLLLLQTQNDKLQADFEKQEGISLQLKKLLQSKDAEISSLLSCRDGQMSGYLEQLQANYRSQVAVYEDRLTSLHYQREKADKELRGFEARVKSLQIKANRCVQEKEQMVAKMESFKNSMVSLQSERERLMSEYRILEAKSELGLKGKEGSADGEGGASKGLKHEIRKLLHQMDDLNSENAMLRAQLVRYREDLNQVLSLKDNQLKVLLKKQHDVIKDLENQKTATEKQHRESQLELQKEEEVGNLLKAELSKFKAQVSKLETEISTQKKDRVSTNEGKVIADLQEAVAVKAAECNDLQQRLLSQKILTDELKEKMQKVENETNKKLAEAEDKYNTELKTCEREVELMRNEQETADQRVAELAKDLLEMEQQLSEARTQSKDMKAQNESLCKAMAALQNDRDQLIEDFKILRNRYDEELRETQAALNKVERSLQDATSDLAMFAKEREILVHKLNAVESKDTHAELNKLLDELSKALSGKERELKQVVLENNMYSRQLSAFSRSMASLQNDRDRLMDELAGTKRVVESRQGSSPETVSGSGVSALQNERDALKMDELRQNVQKMQTYRIPPEEVSSSQEELAKLRSDRERKDTPPVKETVALAGQSGTEEVVSRLEAERVQLHRDLQRCMYEIQQRDQYFQQLNTKLQQAIEERGAVAAQLRAVSQTLRDTQNRCHWLEGQAQRQAQQGSVYAEVAPGAPQEKSNDSTIETAEASQLRERLLEVEQILADERARRETAEDALRLAEDRAKSVGSGLSRDSQRDFSIEMETEEEWEALSLNPNQPLITRKVKGGMVACRRWLRGRSLYFSRLLTSRARSRYFFLAYLLTIHVLVLMCLTGAL
ncbi:golgin subfamily B member 1-like isoform X3 [Xiphias gladius]|uniref:golgin subfamily B member 1-like isoform X3 n=1 Tax=Xiphias gladius TaxID=8245 RepID=UPI001A98725C|nr:golgin subfamily B member 1-like isoform X3 [Xiphias gladius]